MYPEDEANLQRQLMLLIGKQHRNMMKILDYSIHNVRNYASTGFLAINERVAIAVLEKYDGPTVSEYLAQYSVSNDEYRVMLSQVTYSPLTHSPNLTHSLTHTSYSLATYTSYYLTSYSLTHSPNLTHLLTSYSLTR